MTDCGKSVELPIHNLMLSLFLNVFYLLYLVCFYIYKCKKVNELFRPSAIHAAIIAFEKYKQTFLLIFSLSCLFTSNGIRIIFLFHFISLNIYFAHIYTKLISRFTLGSFRLWKYTIAIGRVIRSILFYFFFTSSHLSLPFWLFRLK